MIIKMLNKLRRRIDKHSEELKKELRKYKEETEQNNTIMEIKNTLQGINTRLDDTDEWFNEVEDKGVEITTAEKKKRIFKNKDSFLKLLTSGTMSSILASALEGSKKKNKERGREFIWKNNSWKVP